MKLLTHPETGKTFKMWRRRTIARSPRFALKNYLKQSLPAPPPSCSYVPNAAKAIGQMYENDTLGDCVIACIGHIEGIFTGNANPGNPLILPDSEIIALYSAIGGYVPGDESTDNGCDEQTALNYWQTKGIAGKDKIAAWMSVNAANPVEVRTALWLFENLMFGVELPDRWVNPMPSRSGFWWGNAGDPDQDNGHCFAGIGYTPEAIAISTWGMTGLIDNAAVHKYAAASEGGELYCVLSQDAISKATKKAPTGFDWSQLAADFDSMMG